MSPELLEALRAYDLPVEGAHAERAPSGLIQETHIVTLGDGRRVVAQRMHAIFGPEVLIDTDAVTAHLAAKGLPTPRLLRTHAGALGVHDPTGRLWRLLSWLPGHTVDRVDGARRAEEAGALVARFHRAVEDLDRTFAFVRPGAHDTPAHLAKLAAALASTPAFPERDRAAPLAERILAAGRVLPAIATTPRRVTHGDLKISNILFGDDGAAHALLDLDTLGHLTVAVELGDAWRSWCNPLGEDCETPAFDLEIFAASVHGYARGARGLLVPDEIASLVPGILTIATELAARFCADVFADSYFGWDARRYPSRRAHNLVRAEGQLRLAEDLARRRSGAEKIVTEGFAKPHFQSTPGDPSPQDR